MFEYHRSCGLRHSGIAVGNWSEAGQARHRPASIGAGARPTGLPQSASLETVRPNPVGIDNSVPELRNWMMFDSGDLLRINRCRHLASANDKSI